MVLLTVSSDSSDVTADNFASVWAVIPPEHPETRRHRAAQLSGERRTSLVQRPDSERSVKNGAVFITHPFWRKADIGSAAPAAGLSRAYSPLHL